MSFHNHFQIMKNSLQKLRNAKNLKNAHNSRIEATAICVKLRYRTKNNTQYLKQGNLVSMTIGFRVPPTIGLRTGGGALALPQGDPVGPSRVNYNFSKFYL